MEISKFTDIAGILKQAKSFSFAELLGEVAAIALQFENINCSINVLEDTDELEIVSPPELSGLMEANSELVFHQCIGSEVLWCWTMVNNQGYSDAIKFEFNNYIAFELIAEASSIKQAVVNNIQDTHIFLDL